MFCDDGDAIDNVAPLFCLLLVFRRPIFLRLFDTLDLK